MQVTVETTSELERCMTVVVPADTVESQIGERLKEVSTNVRLNGFRPGKVPMREIRRRFGPGVRQEVTGKLIEDTFQDALKQESLLVAGMPSIRDVTSEDGEDLRFTAEFEVYPGVRLADFAQVSVTRHQAEVAETDVDGMIEELRGQRTEWDEVERPAALQDRVTLDFTGTIDGEPFEGGSGESVPLVLGSGRMIPGFEEQLVGADAGSERTVEAGFPQDYRAKELAGKTAAFAVRVHRVEAPRLPELDDDFAASFGVKEGGLEAFRAEVRGNMQRDLDNALKDRIKQQVMDGLASLHDDFTLPKAMVSEEIEASRQQMLRQFGQGAQQPDASMFPDDLFKEQAERRVRLGLVVRELVRDRALEADEAKVRQIVEEMAATYEQPQQVVAWYYQNPQQLEQVRNMVLQDQVVETVLAEAAVVDRPASYDEVMQRGEYAAAGNAREQTG